MTPKIQLIKHTAALWTLLGVTISTLLMFLFSYPADNFLLQLLWFVMIILMVNAIMYGVGMWVWHVRIYLKSRQANEVMEQPVDIHGEEWGV